MLILTVCLLMVSCNAKETEQSNIGPVPSLASPVDSGEAPGPILDPLFHLETMYQESDFRPVQVGGDIWIPSVRWPREPFEATIPSPDENNALTAQYVEIEKPPEPVSWSRKFFMEVFIDGELIRYFSPERIDKVGEKYGGDFYGKQLVNGFVPGQSILDGFPAEWMDNDTIAMFRGGLFYHLPTKTWIEPEFPQKEEAYKSVVTFDQFMPSDSVATSFLHEQEVIAYIFQCKYDHPKPHRFQFVYLYDIKTKEWEQIYVSQIDSYSESSFLTQTPDGKLLFYADEILDPDKDARTEPDAKRQVIYSYDLKSGELEEYLTGDETMQFVDWADGKAVFMKGNERTSESVVIDTVTPKAIISGIDDYYLIYYGKYIVAPKSERLYDLENMVVYILNDIPATLRETPSFHLRSRGNPLSAQIQSLSYMMTVRVTS